MARIKIEEKVLSENDKQAALIRQKLKDNGILCLNLVSSPGSGKTTLMERTISACGKEIAMAIIAGDVQTDNDAARLRRAGGEHVHPIMTGGACHLTAAMVDAEVARIDLSAIDLLIIENVGNLVCPSSYDLGEDMKVVLISTTEGDDKPLKYPGMFRRSGAMVINKTDLLGTSDFKIENVIANAHDINPHLDVLQLSCRSGEGLETWYDWLRASIRQKAGQSVGDSAE